MKLYPPGLPAYYAPAMTENRLLPCLSRILITLFRIAAPLTLGMLLFFPYFKKRPEGYLPLAISLLAFSALALPAPRLRAWRKSCATALEGASEPVFLALALIVPAMIQAGLVFTFRPEPSFDALFVLREAEQLNATGRMAPLTYYAPGQIWYYVFFFRLFGTSALVAQLCQIPLFMGLIGTGYAIGRRLLSLLTARVATLAVAFYPSMLLYVLVTPYYFYLYTLLILLMVGRWIAVARGEGQSIGPAFFGGLFAGAGALTKAVLLVAPLQALVFCLVAAGHWSRKWVWKAWGVFLVGMGLVIVPWALRNRQVLGETILVCTSGPLVLWSANNPQSDGLYSPLPDEARVTSPREMLEHMTRCRRQAWSFIVKNPGHFFCLVLRKLLHTWGTETTYVELINRRGHSIGLIDPALRLAAQTGWGLLVLFWVMATGRSLLRKHSPTLLESAAAIFVLSKFLVYSLYEGGARHHLPVVPLLMLYVVEALLNERPGLNTRAPISQACRP